MKYKYSKQREYIKEYIMGRTDHPTADMVYKAVKKDLPNISLATVYRNLMVLADMGELNRLSIGDSSDRFDPKTNDHPHFVCKECGSILDMEEEKIDEISKKFSLEMPGEITSYKLTFYGICEKCKASENSGYMENNKKSA